MSRPRGWAGGGVGGLLVYMTQNSWRGAIAPTLIRKIGAWGRDSKSVTASFAAEVVATDVDV